MKNKKTWIVTLVLSIGLTACAKKDVEKREVVIESNEEVIRQEDTAVLAGIESKDVNKDGHDDIRKRLELEKINSDKPENAYKEILDLYYQALFERLISQEPELDQYYMEYNLPYSILAPYWAWESSENILSREGFAFLDLNDDGVEELLLGWADNEFWNMDEGYVFAVYTIVEGDVVLALEGWERCLYVIGEDGYLYKFGSSSVWEGNYTKYRFNSQYEDFLEPVEEIYSYMDRKVNSMGTVCWQHKTHPVEVGAVESLEREEALAIGEEWMTSGRELEYILFSQYEN